MLTSSVSTRKPPRTRKELRYVQLLPHSHCHHPLAPPCPAQNAGNPHERGKSYVYTEADWNISASESHNPYSHSKREAEKLAWEMAHKVSDGCTVSGSACKSLLRYCQPGGRRC